MPIDPFIPLNEDDVPEKPEVTTRDVIDEALAKQAARRPVSSPPKLMPVTPTLPKQPRPARERKRRRGQY